MGEGNVIYPLSLDSNSNRIPATLLRNKSGSLGKQLLGISDAVLCSPVRGLEPLHGSEGNLSTRQRLYTTVCIFVTTRHGLDGASLPLLRCKLGPDEMHAD